MLISHISDLHLGYAQFGLEEREDDIYQSFNEAIDVSIKEGVRAVILAGDLFHSPRPSGKAIITLGNALKKLKESNIAAAFVLGEHDISRLRDVPFAYLFSNLGLAKRLRLDEPLVVDNCVIFGENKERRSNIDSLIDRLRNVRTGQHEGRKKILVLHQGLTDLNKFAGEMNATDLPPGFDYYALGHYHDHVEKCFDFLGGLLAYPGSLDLTPSEGIKETDKGFIIADLSRQETTTHWIRLEQMRKQFSIRINYAEMANEMTRIFDKAKASNNGKKPVARIEVSGLDIDPRTVAASLVRLNNYCLHYVWQPVEEGRPGATAYDSRPADMDSELYRLSAKALESEELAQFAIEEILPLSANGDAGAVLDLVWEAYRSKRFGKDVSK
ncbi:MAG TPA: DNA repair exonuclease [Nitrososphaera sp.]|jgi:DNA repair exonuclease SbcCD nuclease subunit